MLLILLNECPVYICEGSKLLNNQSKLEAETFSILQS